MYNSISSEKGMTLIEVMIAVMLVSIGALSLLATQGPAWNLTGRSDILGRAGMVLHRELGANELLLMNPNVANPCLAVNPLVNVRNVNASDQAVAAGGYRFYRPKHHA